MKISSHLISDLSLVSVALHSLPFGLPRYLSPIGPSVALVITAAFFGLQLTAVSISRRYCRLADADTAVIAMWRLLGPRAAAATSAAAALAVLTTTSMIIGLMWTTFNQLFFNTRVPAPISIDADAAGLLPAAAAALAATLICGTRPRAAAAAGLGVIPLLISSVMSLGDSVLRLRRGSALADWTASWGAQALKEMPTGKASSEVLAAIVAIGTSLTLPTLVAPASMAGHRGPPTSPLARKAVFATAASVAGVLIVFLSAQQIPEHGAVLGADSLSIIYGGYGPAATAARVSALCQYVLVLPVLFLTLDDAVGAATPAPAMLLLGARDVTDRPRPGLGKLLVSIVRNPTSRHITLAALATGTTALFRASGLWRALALFAAPLSLAFAACGAVAVMHLVQCRRDYAVRPANWAAAVVLFLGAIVLMVTPFAVLFTSK